MYNSVNHRFVLEHCVSSLSIDCIGIVENIDLKKVSG